MINLSERLKKMAQRIDKGETMADIGTDHGFLPLYLLESGISPKVIMTDISEKSLEKAVDNAASCLKGRDGRAEFRTGDGLSVLGMGEVDAVVIAGMGGKLIRDIMADDITLTASFDKFILQPRIGQGILRKWLIENGFRIIADDVVREGRHIPEIITVLSPGREPSESEHRLDAVFDDKCMLPAEEDHIMYRIPPWIVSSDGPVYEFLIMNIKSEKEKLRNVMLSKKRNLKLEEKICSDIRYLDTVLKEFENGRKENTK